MSLFADGRYVELRKLIAEAGPHGLWIAFWSIVGIAATAGAPLMLDQPFLLMLLAPRAAFVVLAAPTVGMFWFVILGTLRLSVADASWFVVGRRAPQRIAAIAEQRERKLQSSWPWVRTAARMGARLAKLLCASAPLAALVLFLRPNGKYLGVAGAFGVGSAVAGISSVGGTIVYLIALHLGVAEIFG